mmetsp:Transcript_23865/g.67946  ORF Transcript_23865/g.67946 Transcript_23865/m.67946 type:complete len:274 (-) Transcript_23865:1-822(-)
MSHARRAGCSAQRLGGDNDRVLALTAPALEDDGPHGDGAAAQEGREGGRGAPRRGLGGVAPGASASGGEHVVGLGGGHGARVGARGGATKGDAARHGNAAPLARRAHVATLAVDLARRARRGHRRHRWEGREGREGRHGGHRRHAGHRRHRRHGPAVVALRAHALADAAGAAARAHAGADRLRAADGVHAGADGPGAADGVHPGAASAVAATPADAVARQEARRAACGGTGEAGADKDRHEAEARHWKLERCLLSLWVGRRPLAKLGFREART